MRNLLALVGLVVVGFASAGWYLGWYKIGVESSNPSHPKVGVEFEADKIKADLKSGVQKVEGAISDRQVPGVLTSQPINPGSLPPLPAPPPPPPFNPGDSISPITIPAPPPPSFGPGR